MSSSTKCSSNLTKFHLQLQAKLLNRWYDKKKITFKLFEETAEAYKAQLNPPFGTESSNLILSSSTKCSSNFTKFHLKLQAKLLS
jgi:hypothetical protein